MDFKVGRAKVFASTGGRVFDPAKPAIIFVHGAANDHSVWQLPARHFAHHGFSVAAIDLPGHGRSKGAPRASIAEMARWVDRVRRTLGLERAHLVGHSMGSLVVLAAAANEPEGVNRSVLAGSAPAMPVHPDLLAAARDGDDAAIDLIT